LRSFDVAHFEETSFEQPCANRPEIAWGDFAIESIIPHARLGRRLAFYGVALGVTLGRKWGIGSKSGTDNSRFGAQLREDVAIEGADLRVRVVLGLRQRQDGSEQMIRAEPKIDTAKVPESLHHEPRPNQESESQGELRDDESVA
jgi:hypothetical protein